MKINSVMTYEALKAENERLKAALKLEQEQSAYYERHMWDFHGLAESEAKRADAAERELIKPLSIGELVQRLENQTGEKWRSAPAIRQEHAEWSNATFGNVGPVGPLKHLSKEALEAAADPQDLSEWADMLFLFWDAQRRAGITDEQIENAMIEKLAVNKARSWPEPKDGEPRLHIKVEGE